MHRNRPNAPASQILLGVAVIVIGFLFLLDNLGWMDINYSIHFWPVILIVAGALKISQSRASSGSLVGVLLLAAGGLLLLKGMGLIYLSWRMLAPLLLIGAGIMVVFRSVRRPRASDGFPAYGLKEGKGEELLNIMAILGGYKRRISSQDFRGGEVTALMAGCELDLRDASIEGEAVLNVFSMFGGITIEVPTDWTVVLEGTPILGGFEERTSGGQGSNKRLIVRGYAIMGGLEIRN
ncbi:cell wall-active antibiotics response protein [Massilia sp. MB5]|uniref:LiaI-LiaF-like domain-containing protein n=1 Tax=unclassified Massilia TaxID=2609279 RepID=UPI00067B7A72|nr:MULTISPECIES: DUF5668 domain-containing protein [unclassified Massilia]AKU21603.1 hypothetical protein ACZ75_09130 [Massilia sp. NR 4-1]UMR28803.1 cell wall-active antibiotics response protein [Massilia sp. MB5]